MLVVVVAAAGAHVADFVEACLEEDTFVVAQENFLVAVAFAFDVVVADTKKSY